MIFLILAWLVSSVLSFCPLNSVTSSTRPKCMFTYNILLPFTKAEEFCRSNGGHLASIVNSFEAAAIWENAKLELTNGEFWLGGNDINQNGQFSWVDGTSFTYSKWADGQPNVTNHCISTTLSTGKWQTENCDHQKPFACISELNKKCFAPCDSGWTWNQPTNSCYALSHFNAQSWAKAEAACNEIGAHLVSIHSDDENAFVNSFVMSGMKEVYTKDQFWIGLSQDSKTAKWVWSDNSPSDYMNWAPGEPDNYKQKEHCAMSYADLNYPAPRGDYQQKWNDDICESAMRAAVCKKPAYPIN